MGSHPSLYYVYLGGIMATNIQQTRAAQRVASALSFHALPTLNY
jgi:hypothetical protein